MPDLLKLPKDMNLGEGSGVAVNSKGHVFVFTGSNSVTGTAHGAAAAQLFEFDAAGKFVHEIAGLRLPVKSRPGQGARRRRGRLPHNECICDSD